MKPLISVIIPAYNEQDLIAQCLDSITKQTYKPLEVIVVDDGSNDKTLQIAKGFKVKILTQNHKGPGVARNLAASIANGEILVFVDSDMTFEKDFIADLVAPILKKESIGTFSKNEMNSNADNTWSACWNINRNLPPDRLIPLDYPQKAPVFRAILKAEFEKVGGFEVSGQYTDDWSLSRKLKVESTLAERAKYYHKNPSSISEIFKQARWIGKNEFIVGSLVRKIKSLIFYSLPVSLAIGVYKAAKRKNPSFIIFKVIYDFAVFISVVMSFFKEDKAK